MMARFTSGAENCGYCTAICLKPSSASVALPDRMYCTARSKSARAAGGTSGCTTGAGDSAPPVVAPAAAFAVASAEAPVAAVAAAAVLPAGTGPAGCAEAPAAAGALPREGVELQAPRPMSASATSSAAAPTSQRGGSRSASLEARDHIVCHLRLAVTRGLELGERLKALAHPFVVDAVLGARGIQLVRFDCLLLEREHLLLQQRVVFLEFITLQVLRPLRGHNVLGEPSVQLGHLVGCGGGDLRHLIVGGFLVAVHRGLERVALHDQALLERCGETHLAERIACRLRERQLCLRGEIVTA